METEEEIRKRKQDKKEMKELKIEEKRIAAQKRADKKMKKNENEQMKQQKIIEKMKKKEMKGLNKQLRIEEKRMVAQKRADKEINEQMKQQKMGEEEEMEELYKLLRIEEKKMETQKRADKEIKKKEQEQMKQQRKFQKVENRRMKEELRQTKLELREQKKKDEEDEKQKRLEDRQTKLELREQQKKDEEVEKQKRLEDKKMHEEEMLKKRKETALKGMNYLLNISENYSDFFKEKLKPATEGHSKVLKEINSLQPTIADMKEADDRKYEKSENEDVDVTQQLKYFEGELRQYQIDGVQWLNTLCKHGINGILADEMGLGKTIQVIALICHLMERRIAGPYLIVAPLSTIPNWESEFKRFAPQVPLFVFHGSKLELEKKSFLIKRKCRIEDFQTHPVVLTSYSVPLTQMPVLRQFQWQYIIIDEGHRIKNHESKLAVNLRNLNSDNRLLLTGTPLHNNITELWALLNFLMPHIFNDVDTFANLLALEDVKDENKLMVQEVMTNLISKIHGVLAPFVLRRLKKDVLSENVPKKEVTIYCTLSKLQHDLYSYVLQNNIALLKPDIKKEIIGPRKRKRVRYYEDSEDDFSDEDENIEVEELAKNKHVEKKHVPFLVRLTMSNPVMMYKKIVDHPYLVHFPLDPDAPKKSLLVNEDLITSSGKMIVLDEMLKMLKENGHKVLIFSTLTMTLDLIEEYFIMRGYTYCKLDGSHQLEERKESIDRFNNDANVLAFLLSTRAGGLGLNLIGADTVIFFDRDWNPQADIQAQDRCHRIGQTKPVMIYTLVTKGTIDEKIIEAGYNKRLLEKIVIKGGNIQNKLIITKSDAKKLESELQELEKIFREETNQRQSLGSSVEELEKLLDRSELYAQMNMEYKPIKRENNRGKENNAELEVSLLKNDKRCKTDLKISLTKM